MSNKERILKLPEIDSKLKDSLAALNKNIPFIKPVSVFEGKFYCGATELTSGMDVAPLCVGYETPEEAPAPSKPSSDKVK